jgi:cell wall-associated NlpC family hydrolase
MEVVVNTALAEVGNKETPTNKTKYGKWFGLDGVPWCGIFVSWVYHHAGFSLPNIGFKKGFAGCQTAVAYFKKHKKITTNPEPGDIVFFDWNGDGIYDHTGIYLRHINDKMFETIEGNTSFFNQSNGGQVMVRIRRYKSAIFVKI